VRILKEPVQELVEAGDRAFLHGTGTRASENARLHAFGHTFDILEILLEDPRAFSNSRNAWDR
jgi:hypothetical protein